MTRRQMTLALAAGAMAALLSGCGNYAPASYRTKLTVEVQTPNGMRTGSGVLEVTASKNLRLTSEEHAGSGGLRGEAIAVELPEGPIFALLIPATSDRANGLGAPITLTLSGVVPKNVDEYVAAVRKLGKGSHRAELQRREWPMLVRFRDINDPKSVEQVDPETVGVRRIRLETTRDAVTTGNEKQLGWLTILKGNYLHGGFTGRDAPLGLDGTAFSTEIR